MMSDIPDLDTPGEGDKHWPWTLTLGQIRALDLPDETQVLILGSLDLDEPTDGSGYAFQETSIEYQFPPVLDHPGVLVIGGGQIVNYELDMIDRLDAHLGILGKNE